MNADELLDDAMAGSKPYRRASEYDREDVNAVVVRYLERRAAGENLGSLPWLHSRILKPRFDVVTGPSALQSWIRVRHADLWSKVRES